MDASDPAPAPAPSGAGEGGVSAEGNKPVERIVGVFNPDTWWPSVEAKYGITRSEVTELPFDLDTSQATNLGMLFYGCISLTTVPKMDTSQVTNMGMMFNTCSSLTYVPDLDASKVWNTSGMFQGCKNLKNGKVRLIRPDGSLPQTTNGMIQNSGLTRMPFYTQ